MLILLIILYFLNKLKKQKQEFEAIFKYSKDGIVITDLETNFLDCNDAYLNITSFTKIDLLSTSILKLISLEFKDNMIEAINEVKNKGFIENFETSILVKEQKRIEINMSISTLPDKKRLLIVVKDVTSLKLSDKQVKMASMGEMIGNIAHQWRQPLSVITTSASGLKLRTEYGDNVNKEDIYEFTDNIIAQSQYLSKTIEDFKDFIKGSTEFKYVNVVDIIDSALNITNAVITNNYVKIVKELSETIVIKGNKNELEQVLINLLNNAKDKLCENISEDNRFIFIKTIKIDQNTLDLRICDNGGGINPEIIDRVFEPYFTTKHKSIGTGLGLSIVDKIIRERHNQVVTVHNENFEYDGKSFKGACFTIRFTIK